MKRTEEDDDDDGQINSDEAAVESGMSICEAHEKLVCTNNSIQQTSLLPSLIWLFSVHPHQLSPTVAHHIEGCYYAGSLLG